MFIRYYVELPMAFAETEKALLRSPDAILGDLARRAYARGESLLTEVGFDVGGRRLAKRVAVELHEPVRFDSKTTLPMTWHATGPDGLFPSLEADLEIAPLGRSSTQLAISARYPPPLGALGRALDRGVLHRVAEAAVKDFLDHVGRALIDSAAA
ncbi:MAG: hypothetical protein WEB06_10965 [Actinomycetota bacterium]